MSWDDFFEQSFKCPHCDCDNMVLPSGPEDAEVLIISDFPGKDEKKKGKPLVGNAGTVLAKELAYRGLSIRDFRITNVWLHDQTKNKDCEEHGFQEAIKEAKGRKIVLLAGSVATKKFTGQGVLSVSGLQVKSPMISAPIVMCCPNPASVFNDKKLMFGEFKLALDKFSKVVEEECF